MKSINSIKQVLDFLIEKKVLSTNILVGENFIVENFSRKNLNYKLFSDNDKSVFLKKGYDLNNSKDLQNEGLFYSEIVKRSKGKLCKFTPSLLLFDSPNSILCIQLLKESLDLNDFIIQEKHFSISIGEDLANALFILHNLNTNLPKSNFVFTRPSILAINNIDVKFMKEFSSANIELIKILQNNNTFITTIKYLNDSWSSKKLIHGDIKFENILVSKDKNLYIIDWELFGYGEPMWDVGSIFGSYLNFWIESIPFTGHSLERSVALSKFPLDDMKGMFDVFWKTYIANNNIELLHQSFLLQKAILLCAIRLLQTAFEVSLSEAILSAKNLYRLQLALNVLKEPEKAGFQLLGIK